MTVAAPERPDTIAAPPPGEGSGRRRAPRRSAFRTIAAVAVAALVVLGVGRVADLLPSLGNPFRTESVDRTGPAVLHALDDISEYRAVTGNFQVILDLEEDTRFVPSFVKGERTVFVAAGTVDGMVDFSSLDAASVTVSDDRRGVTLTLPPATLSEPQVDPERSYVADRDRGLLDRLGSVFSDSPTGERDLYLLAGDRLRAAAAEAGLVEAAQGNTKEMLESLLRSLGFERVTIRFAPPVASSR